MAYIVPSLRQEVIERAHGRCEYCLTSRAIVVEMEIDHVVPESAGGPTVTDNLCLTCIGCSRFSTTPPPPPVRSPMGPGAPMAPRRP